MTLFHFLLNFSIGVYNTSSHDVGYRPDRPHLLSQIRSSPSGCGLTVSSIKLLTQFMQILNLYKLTLIASCFFLLFFCPLVGGASVPSGYGNNYYNYQPFIMIFRHQNVEASCSAIIIATCSYLL